MNSLQIAAARLVALASLVLTVAGCASSQPHFTAAGAVFYCGGAGEDGLLANWGGGVKEGLLAAGYAGTFDDYHWETGLGVITDQDESVKAKRAQATRLAQRVATYESQFPDSPVTMIGLSAGTAIVIICVGSAARRQSG